MKKSQIVKAEDRDLRLLKEHWTKWTDQPIPLIEQPKENAFTKARIKALTKEIQNRRKEIAKALGLYRGLGDSHPSRAALEFVHEEVRDIRR